MPLPLVVMNIFGWVVMHKRLVFITIGLIVLLFAVVGLWRACTPEKGKLNEQEIQKAEEAIRERNDRELRGILANADAREAQIDANLANAEQKRQDAVQEAKEKYANMNTSDLAAELEKRK